MMFFSLIKSLLSKDSIKLTTRSTLLLQLIVVPSILVVVQLYHALTIRQYLTIGHLRPQNDSTIEYRPLRKLSTNESFGACLMMKEDNDLFYEWLAYHYTVLPLHYVYVGSDEGNQQDPRDVLRRWKTANIGLEYWVVNSTDFGSTPVTINFTGSRRPSYSAEHEDAHHSFVHRQRAFMTSCVRFLRSQGLHWVTFIDTDEFLVINRMSEEEKAMMQQNDRETLHHSKAVETTAYQMRNELPAIDNQSTIVDILRRLEHIEDLGSCYTIPRLLYGALENVTCPDASTVTRIAQSKFHYKEMSTLRFTQHARKGDFAKSKYGKVMINLSRLSDETVGSTPRNIHRPYKPECKAGASGNFAHSSFYLNHYIGSWERYNSREDSRRNREEWERRAHLTAGDSCEHAVYNWFPRFLEIVGEERAQYLLGFVNTIQ